MNIRSLLFATCLAACAAHVGANPLAVSTSMPVAICDLCTVTSVLNVTTHGQLLDVDALIDITHSWDADLALSLSHGGATVLLSNRQGGSGGANYAGTIFDDQAAVSIAAGYAYAPYSGAFRPQEALAAFVGSDVFGLWTLVVTDFEAGDSGTINRFGIVADVPEPGVLALFAAGLAGLVRSRRRARA